MSGFCNSVSDLVSADVSVMYCGDISLCFGITGKTEEKNKLIDNLQVEEL